MRDRPFDETVIELLRKDSEFAVELLDVALKENTPAELAIVLRQIRAAGYSLTLEPKQQAKPTPKRTKSKRVKTGATKTVDSAKTTKPARRLPSRSPARRPAAAMA